MPHGTLSTNRLRGVLLLSLVVVVLAPSALARDTWELSVCASIGTYPMSDQQRGGFDNDIAELLADELGAEATFYWTNFDDFGVRDSLHSGLCDLAIGVGENVAEMLSTVPYLQAPYVFVTRTENNIAIESLDDPLLRTLTIGTYQAGIPSIALRNRDAMENVTEYAAIIRPTGADAHTPILDAVASGAVEVGIVYGPAAAGRVLDEPGVFTLEPVTPTVDFGASLLQLSRILTIGVRPHDEALRDSLNRALAHRWDDVVAILDAYGVPQVPITPPLDTRTLVGIPKIGVILPARTPASLPNAPIGDDALRGASVAENAAAIDTDRQSEALVLIANAPTIESVARAADRLILLDDVSVLIGGYNATEAALLATVAAKRNVAFFNVGSEDDSLRNAVCYPTTFHVPPSTAMLLAGMIEASATNGPDRVFAIVERGVGSLESLESLSQMVVATGGQLVASALVDPGQFVYYPVLEQIEESGADTVIMLMSSDAQEVLMGQAGDLVPTISLLGVATVAGQSRPYLQRFMQVSPEAAAEQRVVVWDPAADSPLNDTFAARTGEPMEPAAWTTYAAVTIAFQAARAAALATVADVHAFLTAPAAVIEVGKASPVGFRQSDGQMVQELYVINLASDAQWGRTAAARTALASVTGVIPSDATAGAATQVATGCEQP